MKKLKITYGMKKGEWEHAESYIEIPCTEEKHKELMDAAKYDCWHHEEPFTELTNILKGICKLQGYKLDGYQLEEGDLNVYI
jgi:hypothetical protein